MPLPESTGGGRQDWGSWSEGIDGLADEDRWRGLLAVEGKGLSKRREQCE